MKKKNNLNYIFIQKEDIVRTLKDTFLIENKFLNMLNVIDTNNLACIFINFLRNVLRFISTYISKN
jgi:hypothetical protein